MVLWGEGLDSIRIFPKGKQQTSELQITESIYTADGIYFDNLHRFKRKDAPNCECGELGIPKNYLTACHLTKPIHRVQITTNNGRLWQNKLPNNKHVKKQRQSFDQMVDRKHWLNFTIKQKQRINTTTLPAADNSLY